MKAILMLIAIALLALGALIGAQRVMFVASAVPVSGTVVEVAARDDRCGRRPRRACTKFTAIVEYGIGGETRRMRDGAGSSRGRGQPISEANVRVGDAFALKVNPKTREALPDSFRGLWGLPAVLVMFGVLCGLFGLWHQRRG